MFECWGQLTSRCPLKPSLFFLPLWPFDSCTYWATHQDNLNVKQLKWIILLDDLIWLMYFSVKLLLHYILYHRFGALSQFYCCFHSDLKILTKCIIIKPLNTALWFHIFYSISSNLLWFNKLDLAFQSFWNLWFECMNIQIWVYVESTGK